MNKYINLKTIGGSIALSLACYLVYEYNPKTTQIRLTYDDNPVNQSIVSSLHSLHKKRFYPSLLCTGPLQQALMNHLLEDKPVSFTRETLSLSDGGQIVLDWALPLRKADFAGTPLFGKFYPYQPPKDTKILLIMHGLTGGSETTYIQTLVDTGSKNGYRVAVMNQRGVNQLLSTPLTFHGGHLQDVAAGINHIKKSFPDAPIVAVGTSFGANQLMRYLGEVKEKTNIVGAVLLSTPFDIDDVVNSIEKTVYEDFLVKTIFRKNILPSFEVLKSLKDTHGVDFEEVFKTKNLRDFHHHFTVKVHNHRDVAEYFDTINIKDSHISNIQVPMLLLHAKDDPIAVYKSLPLRKLAENPNIIVAETARGGHLCWFTGLRPKRWYDKPTMEFLNKVLELKMSQGEPEIEQSLKLNHLG